MRHEKDTGVKGLALPDTYTLAALLDPTCVVAAGTYQINVELGGNFSRGQIVLNKLGREFKNFIGPLTVYETLDKKKYCSLLKNAVKWILYT